MALVDVDRLQVWKEMINEYGERREDPGLTKSQLRAALDALDDWLDTNLASLNSAIPLPARTRMTAKQKAKMVSYLLRLRAQRS